MRTLAIVIPFVIVLSACGPKVCDSDAAYNKMLALGAVQGRLAADGGETSGEFAAFLGTESGKVSELIAQGKFVEACAKADEIAAKYKIDLATVQKDIITIEQLRKDGGKGSGTCSLADASKKQMELHGLLQKQVEAGKMDSDIFRRFNDDTRAFGEYLSTDPSKACKLIEDLKVKYGV